MKYILFISLFTLSLSGFSQILNMETYRIKTDTIGWAGKFGMDVSITKNTKSLTRIGTKIHLQYKTAKSLILLLGQYNLLASDAHSLIDKSVLHLRYNYKFTPVISGEYFIQVQKNSISKIDLRSLIGSGLRFKLSQSEAFHYYVGTTVMYEYEKTSILDIETYWRWSNYISFSLFPNKNTSIVSTTYYQPVFSDFSNFRISSQNAVYFKITTHLAFKTGFNYNYDSHPVFSVPKIQYNLNTGLVYAL